MPCDKLQLMRATRMMGRGRKMMGAAPVGRSKWRILSKVRNGRRLSGEHATELPRLLRRPHGCHGYKEADRWWLTDFGVETSRIRWRPINPIKTPWGMATVSKGEHTDEPSREEAFRLISAPGRALVGHDRLPQWSWLPEPDVCKAPIIYPEFFEEREGEDEVSRSERLADRNAATRVFGCTRRKAN